MVCLGSLILEGLQCQWINCASEVLWIIKMLSLSGWISLLLHASSDFLNIQL